jgi:hypothetical protein
MSSSVAVVPSTPAELVTTIVIQARATGERREHALLDANVADGDLEAVARITLERAQIGAGSNERLH